MQQIAHRIRGGQGFEPDGYDPDYMHQFANIDLCWMENTLFTIEEQPSSSHQENTSPEFVISYDDQLCELLIVIGEADVLAPEMVKPPFTASARIPKQSEVFALKQKWRSDGKDEYEWDFKGRFSPRGY